MSVRILIGDVRARLKELPSDSVDCCVTSPPYWGLRDYGVAGQLGCEPTWQEHVAVMVEVFREVRRILKPSGTLWLNYGDSYASSVNGRPAAEIVNDDRTFRDKPFSTVQGILKPKDLCGIPWRVAFALQADGWWLRQDIIWAKPNPMPESVTDRCTKAHEYIFLLTKAARYYFDAEAIKEANSETTFKRFGEAAQRTEGAGDTISRSLPTGRAQTLGVDPAGRNKRSVWEIATQPFSEAHFATFPPALIEPCIKAGTSEKGCCSQCGKPWERQTNEARVTTTGWAPSCKCSQMSMEMGGYPCTVLDPFGGAGTTGLVADRLGRNAILIELNPEYAAIAERRIAGEQGMFKSLEIIAA